MYRPNRAEKANGRNTDRPTYTADSVIGSFMPTVVEDALDETTDRTAEGTTTDTVNGSARGATPPQNVAFGTTSYVYLACVSLIRV